MFFYILAVRKKVFLQVWKTFIDEIIFDWFIALNYSDWKDWAKMKKKDSFFSPEKGLKFN